MWKHNRQDFFNHVFFFSLKGVYHVLQKNDFRSAFAPDFKELDENVDYEERESEFDLEDEDKSVQLNEEHKDIDVEVFFPAKTSLVCLFVSW